MTDFTKYILFYVIIALSLSCSKEKEQVLDFSVIHLKWNKSYSNQTIEDVITGLNWTLLNIGASIKSNDYLEISDHTILLNTKALNFEDNGRETLLKLHESIFNSEEYTINKNIDIGRYVCLLLGAPNHYSQLVGMPNTLQDLLSKYQILPEKGKINNSTISLVDRIIEYSSQANNKQLFLSTEIDSVTDSIYEYETIEIMQNGQLKFGIYGKNGFRKNSADPLITNAGKIAKCMWCHEFRYIPASNRQVNEPGFLLSNQLNDTINMYQQKLFTHQTNLTNSVVDFSKLQEHTKMELLYISFMHPSAVRLSNEWGLSVTDVTLRLGHLTRHTYGEFPFLGLLYHREEVEKYSPFHGLKVSSSVREKSQIEVNHL